MLNLYLSSQVFDFELSSDDMKTIDSFDCNGRVLHLNWQVLI